MAANRQPLHIGQRLRLRSVERRHVTHTTRVEEVAERWFSVQRPTHHYQPVRLPPGTKVEVVFVRTEPPEGIFRGESVVMGETRRRRVALLRLHWPDQWERAQLREYFRVAATRPVRVRFLPAEEGAPWFEGLTRDISGGGAQISLAAPLETGQALEVELDLPDGVHRMRATVRRAVEDPPPKGLGTLAGIKFENLPERQREEIIRYAFERQIELRRKGGT